MEKTMQAAWDSSPFAGQNQSYLEELYELYLEDKSLVSEQWQEYFKNINTKKNIDKIEESNLKVKEFFTGYKSNVSQGYNHEVGFDEKQANVHDFINGYRLLGHLYAQIDPLNLREIKKVEELELDFYGLSSDDLKTEFDTGSLGTESSLALEEILRRLKKIYCNTVAIEYMHISDSEERQWMQEQIETNLLNNKVSIKEKNRILEGLIAAEGLEKYLHNKYPGAKRFGLEGCDSLLILLDTMITMAANEKMQEVVIGMAHRGRLNVLVNILGKMPGELFDEFEGKHSKLVESGDVKYHQGFSSDVKIGENKLHLSLAFNPSHLEIVAPVVAGAVRAKQRRRGFGEGRNKVLAISIHGDSAFAGQGVVMETLNMSQTRGYKVGGTVRIILNNQVGFTTSNINDTRSTLYCSDLGKMISAPIFHVNVEDPENVFTVAKIALAYRNKFKKDVIIDLVGYRKSGHNEADEPFVTQPLMYKVIRKKDSVRKVYSDYLEKKSEITKDKLQAMINKYKNTLEEKDRAVVKHLVKNWKSEYATDWTPYNTNDWRIPTSTKVDINKLKQIANLRDNVPDNFTLHSRVKKIIDDRKKMTKGELLIDWGYAETLAYASLLMEGYKIRLSGQDCGRGTFFHRHAIWHEQNTGEEYISLCHLDKNQATLWIINSLLSEAAVLGFEYGFSTSEPRALVIWEAQFGDFANNAQVVIDQFISSGEQKWGRLCGLVMLLPHGYEGQGPEHSSARLERYLQLCAQHNIQVCIPSTPSQVYHMLRRQMLRPLRKPLIVMTPKSLLRHKEAVSTLDELSNGQFEVILPEPNIDKKQLSKVERVILCSGKVYYELLAYKRDNKIDNAVIIRLEQLYPFPELELYNELKKYKKADKIVWCQEEPKNQGAWYSCQHHIIECLTKGQKLIYAGREASASPAVGYANLHKEQAINLVKDAFMNKEAD